MVRFVLMLAASLCLSTAARAQWAVYPGAQRDAAAEVKAAEVMRAAGMGAGSSQFIATTPDSFEKVLAFYRSRGKEMTFPLTPGQAGSGYERELPGGFKRGANGMEATPSGIKAKQVFFIFDGAADLATSKDWISITRPYVGEVVPEGGVFKYRDVRDVTAIVRAQKQ